MLAGNLRWGASESFPGVVCKTQVVTLVIIYFSQVTQPLEKTKWWRLHVNFWYLKINKRSSGVTRYRVEKTANKSPGHTTTGPLSLFPREPPTLYKPHLHLPHRLFSSINHFNFFAFSTSFFTTNPQTTSTYHNGSQVRRFQGSCFSGL